MTDRRDEQEMTPDTKTLVMIEYARRPPTTQQECCDLAARVNVRLFGEPSSHHDLLTRATNTAIGLFGPAFEEAGEEQRLVWIDMCEKAFRKLL